MVFILALDVMILSTTKVSFITQPFRADVME